MQQRIAVGEGDYLNIADALMACTGFKMAFLGLLGMLIDVQNHFNQPALRAV
ncbi:hypothetical protein [Kluyvera georgiana]|uniref:hypothetical protein n=1 Tax=Kluyvera georgiana TaxID=73098 RepID=UPI0023026D0B|nr:hypothetical protein [Kluyvera georgiana]MDA8494477.1 hypothetical protein [Kluyvera georgiana]